MKKLILILIAFLPLISFAQFEGGEWINADTSKISGQSLIYAAPAEGENYYTKMRDPSDSLDGVNLRTLFRRIAQLDSLGILVTNVVTGNQTINTGTTNIPFETPFDSIDVTVVPFVRRISDEAVIDYRIDEVNENGFNVTVWEDNIKLSYVASQKNPKSNAFFNNILLKSDTSTISIDTTQVRNLLEFVSNHGGGSGGGDNIVSGVTSINSGIDTIYIPDQSSADYTILIQTYTTGNTTTFSEINYSTITPTYFELWTNSSGNCRWSIVKHSTSSSISAGIISLDAGNNQITIPTQTNTNYNPVCQVYTAGNVPVAMEINYNSLNVSYVPIWVNVACFCRWTILKY